MNDTRIPIRWRLTAMFGPELVALAISAILVAVVAMALLGGGAGRGSSPGPTPSPSGVTVEHGTRTLMAWS